VSTVLHLVVGRNQTSMQNDAGEYVDMYIPRKWLVIFLARVKVA